MYGSSLNSNTERMTGGALDCVRPSDKFSLVLLATPKPSAKAGAGFTCCRRESHCGVGF